MNKSILYRSFKYQQHNFDLMAKLSMSIYEVLCQELYTDNKFKNILYAATNNNDYLDICESIMRFVRDPTMLNDYLVSCCLSNNIRFAKLLLPHIVDIHFKDNDAMYSACLTGNLTIARMLIDHGSDIHHDDDSIVTRHKYYANRVMEF